MQIGWQPPSHASNSSHIVPPASRQYADPSNSSHRSTASLPNTADGERECSSGRGSPTDRFIVHERTAESHDGASVLPGDTPQTVDSNDRLHNPDTDIEVISQPLYSADPLLPFKNEIDAMLFRHYVHQLSIWLDLCDPCRSFQTIVPEMAIYSPLLLNAILAFAMRHLTNTDRGNYEARAIQSQIDCVRCAISAHGSGLMRADGSLFAAIVILRVVQEMEAANYNQDNQTYMSRMADLVQDVFKEDRDISQDHLLVACFWVGLRQEIYIAAMKKQPLRISFISPIFEASQSLTKADDYEWANRAVAHCAFVLNHCFGSTQPPELEEWKRLMAWNREWERNLPLSSQPIYNDTGEDVPGVFPRIMYNSSCHVIGVQHHILAKLTLFQHDPTVPRAGGARKMVQDEYRRKIKYWVRIFCGIGQTNDWTAPGMFTTCMAIASFGEYFQDRRDQTAMLEILRKAQKDHARPTEKVRRKLLRVWGWDPKDWPAVVSKKRTTADRIDRAEPVHDGLIARTSPSMASEGTGIGCGVGLWGEQGSSGD
ncbi:hypothetical protein GQ53DRAFT_669561 [Thozetella sp. PMI_491]|nr:hypothetical protein GQ53DRAFT_669561 [Thozetella sp. PMI_491]